MVRDLITPIVDITAWLDAENPSGRHEDSMHVLKLIEEAGEAAAAYIGMVGQNPRKGVTHTMDDLLKELADVAITALCAIQHFTQDEIMTRRVIAGTIYRIISRATIPTPNLNRGNQWQDTLFHLVEDESPHEGSGADA